jgi:hypothetical protein
MNALFQEHLPISKSKVFFWGFVLILELEIGNIHPNPYCYYDFQLNKHLFMDDIFEATKSFPFFFPFLIKFFNVTQVVIVHKNNGAKNGYHHNKMDDKKNNHNN